MNDQNTEHCGHHLRDRHVHMHDANYCTMVRCLFHGKMRWLAILMIFYSLAFLGICIWAAIGFFETNIIKDLIIYSTVFIVSAFMMMFCKFAMWVIMNRNLVLIRVESLLEKFEHGHPGHMPLPHGHPPVPPHGPEHHEKKEPADNDENPEHQP